MDDSTHIDNDSKIYLRESKSKLFESMNMVLMPSINLFLISILKL